MATKFQIKRTSISGRTPNTTNAANTSYIAAGELALNLTDKKLYSSDGTAYFEVGAFNVQQTNLTSNVTTYTQISTLQFDEDSGFAVTNPSTGVAKIAINSTFKFWQVNGTTQLTASGLDTVNFISGDNISIIANGANTPQSISFSTSLTPTFTSATFGNSTVNTTVNSTSIAVTKIVANGTNGTAGDVLFSNGTGAYWAASGALSTNVNASFAWTNTHSFSNTVTFNGAVHANGAAGTNGQVLTANATGGVYWANSSGGDVSVSKFVYTIASNTTVLEGPDDTTKVLAYTINKESVYLNGVKLVKGSDYTQSNTTAVTLTSNAISGDIVEIVAVTGADSSESFKFTIASNTVNITGNDDNTVLFTYVAGYELVYLNGIKLASGSDYTAPNTTHIVLSSNAISGDIVEVITYPAQSATADLANPTAYGSGSTSILTIDTYNAVSYRTAKYLVQANTVDSFHSSEAIVVHDGTTAYISEYGMVYSNGSLFTLSADINAGDVRLRVTPTRSGTTFKSKRIIIEV